MTRTALIAVALLALAACGKKDAADGNQALSDEDFTREAIVANDVTAIDAATGDAANMAADVAPDAVLDNGEDTANQGADSQRSTARARHERAAPKSSRTTDGPATTPPAEAATAND